MTNMARVTYVKKAQQRYETVPLLDEDGNQKKVPVMKRDGTQKTTKTGRPVFRRLTVTDKTKPKPLRKCEKCGKTIELGMPYKHVSPKSGPYGGVKRIRCADCPSWKPSELSSSKMASIMAAQEEFDVSDCESVEDINDRLNDFAATVREVGEEYKESAQNMEDGFGHSTEMSQDLESKGDELDGWADDLENGVDEKEPDACEAHTDEGNVAKDGDDCEACQELWDDALEEMRNEADDKINSSPF
jgi:hypothetical protein